MCETNDQMNIETGSPLFDQCHEQAQSSHIYFSARLPFIRKEVVCVCVCVCAEYHSKAVWRALAQWLRLKEMDSLERGAQTTDKQKQADGEHRHTTL